MHIRVYTYIVCFGAPPKQALCGGKPLGGRETPWRRGYLGDIVYF